MGEELDADFQREYGLDLGALQRDRTRPLLSTAALAANLPHGCRVWQALGGAQAWSPEVDALMQLEFRLRVLAWQQSEDGTTGRNRPEPKEPPKSRAAQQDGQRTLERRADRYLRRQREQHQRG